MYLASKRFKTNNKFTGLAIVALVQMAATLLPSQASAVPAFARQTGMSCNACHTANPDLNAFGRFFKEQGYRMSFEQDPAGPQAFKDFLPFAVQGVMGVSTSQEDPQDDLDAGVDALQLFMGGPIAPRTSVYIHHHIILQNEPGPLHEAQLRFDRPGDVPVSLRVGKFEPWLANSPGKTILTHEGYNPYNVSVGVNDSTFGKSRFGAGSLWFLGDDYRVDLELVWTGNGPEALARPFMKVMNGELGLILNAGKGDLEGELTGGSQVAFDDTYGRIGLDTVLFPASWLELGATALWASHTNPDGSDSATRYGAGFLEAEFFPNSWFAGVVRYEHIQFLDQPESIMPVGTTPTAATPTETESHKAFQGATFFPLHGGDTAVAAGPGAPDTRNWFVLSAQAFVHSNVKFQAEYRLDLQDINASTLFAGTHFSF